MNSDTNPRLSIVIPTYNEAEHIRETLTRVRSNPGLERWELFVVDGGSTDGTREIAEEFGPVIVTNPGRARQMNAGLKRARGSVVLFCHADTLLPEEYGRTILDAFQDPRVVGGAFRLRYHPSHPLLRLAAFVLRLPTPYLMFGDQAMFARSSILERIGGVPDLALMEDVALALALAQEGDVTRLKSPVTTSSRRFMEQGVVRQLTLVLRLLIKFHVLGVSPGKLEKQYHTTSRDVSVEDDMPRAVLGVFAKAPLPGLVKTRLGEELGMEQAASVYESILRSVLSRFMKHTTAFHKILYVAGRRDHPWFRENFPSWHIQRQQGDSLGDRMLNVFQRGFEKGADRIVIVGTDVPDLNMKIIHRSFHALDEGDLVLGPARDGGYYLIGLKRAYPRLFKGISWGGPRVLEETLARADELGLEHVMLEPLVDIDTLEDWQAYQDRLH